MLTVPTNKVPNKDVPLEKTVGFEPVEQELLQGQNQPSFTTQQHSQVSPLREKKQEARVKRGTSKKEASVDLLLLMTENYAVSRRTAVD